MSTLMKKDVLIEMVAHAQVIVTKRVPVDSDLTDEEKRLGELRNHLYSTLPKDVCYSAIADEVKEISKNKLIIPQYL